MNIEYNYRHWDVLHEGGDITTTREWRWEAILDKAVGCGKTKEEALEMLAQNLNCKLQKIKKDNENH